MTKKKKRILFALYTMNIGGVEKAFLNLLATLDPREYDIDLVLLIKCGGFLKDIPPYVHVEELSLYGRREEELRYPLHHLALNHLRRGHLFRAFRLASLSLANKIGGSTYPHLHAVFRGEKMRAGKYDVAVSYASPFMFIDYYVVNRVRADKKICWIHFDVSRSGIDRGAARKIYGGFDKINIVSADAKKVFDNIFPEFAHKTALRYNDINVPQIRSLAEEFNPRTETPSGRYVICTVGRLTPEKGQIISLPVLRRLIDRGYDVEWWYVGDGNMRQACEKKASELGVTDRVRFFGSQSNPYPYMARCDAYVQTSRHEGFCITLAEAKVFEKPIVSTSFSGAEEQLSSYPRGIVADREALDEVIARMLDTLN